MDFRIREYVTYGDVYKATHSFAPGFEYDEVNKLLKINHRLHHIEDIKCFEHEYNVFFGRLINRAKFYFTVPYNSKPNKYAKIYIAVERLSKEVQEEICNFLQNELGIERK